MTNPFELYNKTILVTGASSGIGKQVAKTLAAFGAKVVLTGRNPQRLQETFRIVSGEGHLCFSLDLNDYDAVDQMVNQLPVINGLVHAAGILKVAPLRILTKEDSLETINTNYLAPFKLVQSLLNQKKLANKSSVVFITSINGTSTNVKGFGLYASSKAALNSLSRTLALEYATKGIRFNTIAPGMIKTEMYEELMKTVSVENINQDKKRYPLGDYGDPEDVANACIYLLADSSKWVTGTTLIVDGGLTII